MVLMQSTVNDGLTYVVLKDRAEIIIITDCFRDGRCKHTAILWKVIRNRCGSSDSFACHPLYGTLFYATKDRIYEFDMKKPKYSGERDLSFPGRNYKVLKFNPFSAFRQYKVWEDMRSEHLVVGTTIDGADEKGCGIMRTYEFEPQWDKALF